MGNVTTYYYGQYIGQNDTPRKIPPTPIFSAIPAKTATIGFTRSNPPCYGSTGTLFSMKPTNKFGVHDCVKLWRPADSLKVFLYAHILCGKSRPENPFDAEFFAAVQDLVSWRFGPERRDIMKPERERLKEPEPKILVIADACRSGQAILKKAGVDFASAQKGLPVRPPVKAPHVAAPVLSPASSAA